MSDDINTMREKLQADIEKLRKDFAQEPDLLEILNFVYDQWDNLASAVIIVAHAIHSCKFRTIEGNRHQLKIVQAGLLPGKPRDN